MGLLDIFKVNGKLNNHSNLISKKIHEWKLDTPVYFSDWIHSIANAISGYKTPMRLQFTANGTFSFEITNKDIYEKNNNEELIKELVAGQCANFLSEMASKETFNSERNLKEQISELDLLDYVKKYTGDIGISVTEITLNSLELTDDSIAKIKEYNKRLK